ncbi:MAG: DUF2065 domain-containing protein [Candidatus Competibacteraceae bacterium]|nr:DUF2065 domain-containing protein [Candidatus Competibacteraceae bacterium]
MWNEMLAAFGLMMVFEGIMPFLSPRASRQAWLRIAQLDDRLLRLTGLGSMGLGLAVLYFFR